MLLGNENDVEAKWRLEREDLKGVSKQRREVEKKWTIQRVKLDNRKDGKLLSEVAMRLRNKVRLCSLIGSTRDHPPQPHPFSLRWVLG